MNKKLSLSKTKLGFIFLIPACALIAFSNIIPFIWNLILSFQKWNAYDEPKWIFFDNFIKAFDDSVFKMSIVNSIFLGISSTIISVFLGVVLALAVFRLGRTEGAIYRLILFMPSMMPMSVIGLMFIFMLNYEYGIVNQILRFIGLGSLTKAWLSDPKLVMWVLTIVRGWKGLGLPLMLCVAAMQGIPDSLFESATLDGASTVSVYRKIVLPLIKPIIELSFVLTLMSSFKSYDIVKIMSNGGPGRSSYVVPMHMLDAGFVNNKFGYAAAMGTLFTVIILIIVVIAQKLLKGGEQYEY